METRIGQHTFVTEIPDGKRVIISKQELERLTVIEDVWTSIWKLCKELGWEYEDGTMQESILKFIRGLEDRRSAVPGENETPQIQIDW